MKKLVLLKGKKKLSVEEVMPSPLGAIHSLMNNVLSRSLQTNSSL